MVNKSLISYGNGARFFNGGVCLSPLWNRYNNRFLQANAKFLFLFVIISHTKQNTHTQGLREKNVDQWENGGFKSRLGKSLESII